MNQNNGFQGMNSWGQNQQTGNNVPYFNQAQQQFTNTYVNQPNYASQFVQQSSQQVPNTYAAQQLAMGQGGYGGYNNSGQQIPNTYAAQQLAMGQNGYNNSGQQMPNTYAAQQLAQGGYNNFDTNQLLRQQFQQQNMNSYQNGWNIP